jgi:tRNA threonylcarbamoyladenosine biosynthesis protein TsaB
MIALAIETSARPASVAAADGRRVLVARLDGERAHAGDLLPELDRMLAELGARPRDVARVFAGLGPGSYTGLRVGLATALGLARASGAALCCVPSGETIAYRELAPGREGVLLLDARAGELYFARYRRTEDDVDVLHEPCVVRPDELAGLLPPDVPIFGDATVARAAGLAAADELRLRADAVASADALLALGRVRIERRGAQRLGEVEPLYLRPFAAKARRR